MGARLTRRASGRLDRRTANPPQAVIFFIVGFPIKHGIGIARIIGFMTLAHTVEDLATILQERRQ